MSKSVLIALEKTSAALKIAVETLESIEAGYGPNTCAGEDAQVALDKIRTIFGRGEK